MYTVKTLVIYQSRLYICFSEFLYPQAQYIFVFDALLESIKYGNNCIIGPVSFAKEKLIRLAMVNSTTKMSGYKSQFEVSVLSQIAYRSRWKSFAVRTKL